MEGAPADWALFHEGSRAEALRLGTRSVTVLGRSGDSHLALKDKRISRRHAAIQHVEDQFLLRDIGSANGTFLNGLRIAVGRAFALRDGDVIELGDTRLVFGNVLSPPSSRRADGTASSSHALDELLRDGWESLEVAERERVEAEILDAFAETPRFAGMERSLGVIAHRVGADAVAVFLGELDALRPVVTFPSAWLANVLLPIARRAATSGKGQLHRATTRSLASSREETDVIDMESAAAVPLVVEDRVLGAVGLARAGLPFDRAELAHAAALAHRIAVATFTCTEEADDTRLLALRAGPSRS
jgi:pSer/pThr/pTyr-binding forkhead associated (FHA) protein